MIFSTILVTLVSLVSWTEPVAADLRITANHHSFGGVNYPQLQFFTPEHRDNTIREIISSGARVIRLFIRPDNIHPDPESELGGFDKSLLDQFDDTLAAIHHLSKGQLKVIIAPHDAHALRGSNGVPCDAYCKKLEGAFLDFYSLDEYRDLYKTRLEVFFKHYPSKNFDGRSWSELSEIILGVDLQHQPFSGIFPIPAGESWLCNMASFLKFTIGLDNADIAVISGGVSGPQKMGEFQNFPDSVFDCKAIDVIGIHGYFSKQKDATAGTPWANMFVPGNTLTSRAKGKKGKGKLLLVEEWAYVHNEDYGLSYKKEAIFDQGNALNYRGIPWLYSHLTTLTEETSQRINPLHPTYTSWTALKDVLTRSLTTRSNFDWSKYLPVPTRIMTPTADEQTAQRLRSMLTGEQTQEWKLAPLGLSNLTTMPLNPYVPAQAECTFGCEGHLCDAQDACDPSLLCMNSVCARNGEGQPGKVGDRCHSKMKCQPHLRCSKSEDETGKRCSACTPRKSIQKAGHDEQSSIRPNDAMGSCYTDSPAHIFSPLSLSQQQQQQQPICLSPSTSSSPLPCTQPTHCPANTHCTWSKCVPCLPSDACLGAPCRTNKGCKTGFCNDYGRCDYAATSKKRSFGPGGARMGRNMHRGPARVRDEAFRIVIPEDKARETGGGGL